MSHPDFDIAVTLVKGQCRDAAEVLIVEFNWRFLDFELMNAFSIVFPQFWLQNTCDELFSLYMSTLRVHFSVVGFINHGTVEEPRIVQIDPLLDARTLGLQTSLFKLIMRSNAKSAMEELQDKNLMSELRQKVGQNALMLNRLSEFIKLAEIAITATLGSVEDECTFSTLGFMKSKVRNCLGGHLDTCVKMFSQSFFKHDTLSYSEAISHWHEQKTRLGADL